MTNLEIFDNTFSSHFEVEGITITQARRASRAFWSECDKFSHGGNEDIILQVAERGVMAGYAAMYEII